jgi:acetolactate synthase-1/2/3 large subunit
VSENYSDAIIAALVKEGAGHFFIVAGGGVMYVQESIRKAGLSFTAFHHEQAAAMAADGYHRVTGKIGVVCATTGPGVSNTVTGVIGAFLDSAAIFVIAGQAKTSEITSEGMGRGVRQMGTFEIPSFQLFGAFTKASERAMLGSSPEKVVRNLVATAVADRPGPVYLEIPFDVQNSYVEPRLDTSNSSPHTLKTPNSPEDTRELHSAISDLLISSKRPLIIAGHGVRVAGQCADFRALAESLRIPVVTTQLAKDLLPHSHPSFVGHVGLRGDRAGNKAVEEADLIISLGTSLQTQTTGFTPKQFAPSAKKIIVDFEKSVSAKALDFSKASYFNVGITDALDSLKRSNFRPTDENLSWAKLNLDQKEIYSVRLEPHDLSTKELNIYEFIFVLGDLLDAGAIVVTDAGLCFYAMGQAFRLKDKQRYIVSGGLGSMGYALPSGIGATAGTNNPVVVVTGDGSMQMNVQELATVKLMEKNISIFVINNGGYASIRNTQGSFFEGNHIGSSLESGVGFPNWKKLTEAYDIKYFKIAKRGSLAKDINRALKTKGPKVIEVICQYNQAIFPYVASSRNERGQLVSDSLGQMSPKSKVSSNDAILN